MGQHRDSERSIKNTMGNRELLVVKKNKKGYGVYAGRMYKKGEVICVMHGKKKTPHTLHYHGASFREAQINPLQIGPKTYLELRAPYRYFNHSCQPNAGVQDSSKLFALKPIKKGEEVTFDYSTTIDESFFCKCGSKRCRGVIADFFALPLKLQKFYIRQKAVPAFIEKKYKVRYGK
ncbi:SET domain-containing protein [Candidatus Parcubacteria bacterium]|nr:MAG: SET domain-containing protein [Candidatus Parcubacteria bacterium]